MAANATDSLLEFNVLNHPVALSTFLLIVFIYWLGTHNFYVLKRLNVPGPKPWPFLGNLLDVNKYGGAHMLQLEYMKKYGKVFSVCFGRKPSMMVADPEMVKQIMVKHFANFRNKPDLFKLPPPLNMNLFSAKDEQWRKVRTTLSPTFTGSKMKLMVPLMQEASKTLVKKLELEADTGNTVDIQTWFGLLSLDVILSCAFGVTSNVQTQPNNDYVQQVKDIFKTSGLMRATRILPIEGLRRLFYPEQDSSFIVEVARDAIRQRRQQGRSARKDALHLMMTAHEDTKAEGASRLSDDELLAQAVIFLLAGNETTSTNLSVIMYELIMNPDIQEKLYQEITEAVDADPERPLYELIHNIEYLDCVINEGQRILPTAFNPHRLTTQSCTINGVHFPAGLEVLCATYALHHDADAWSDPETFNPERFRGPENDSRHPYQFIPFGGGPRLCIGAKFALMEIKIALVDILTRFKFVRSPETQVPLALNAGLVLNPRDGVHLRVMRR